MEKCPDCHLPVYDGSEEAKAADNPHFPWCECPFKCELMEILKDGDGEED